MRNYRFVKKINWRIILPAVFLSLFGLISIFSMAWGGAGGKADFYKQLGFFAVALFLALILGLFDLRFLRANSYFVFILYLLAFLLLLGLLFFGTESRGVKGWYKVGPFHFDPVSFAAVILTVLLSKYFSARHLETKTFQPIVHSGLYLLPLFVLVLLQPDLGSALTLVFVWLGILIFSGVNRRHFLILMLIFLVFLTASWFWGFKDYQKERIVGFLRPDVDPKGISWNLSQSKIAVGAGGLFGQGIFSGSQTQYGFLPEARTDFIFSAFAEEFGFLGVSVFIFCLALLFFQILRIAFYSYDNFTRLFAAGFAFLVLSQSFINIGMCLGILPIIGIPLPFVSYGGSHLLGFYLGLGILSSLTRKR